MTLLTDLLFTLIYSFMLQKKWRRLHDKAPAVSGASSVLLILLISITKVRMMMTIMMGSRMGRTTQKKALPSLPTESTIVD